MDAPLLIPADRCAKAVMKHGQEGFHTVRVGLERASTGTRRSAASSISIFRLV